MDIVSGLHSTELEPPSLITVFSHIRAAALSFTAILALPLLFAPAIAVESGMAALLVRAGSLPDMAIGSAKAPITIVEYSSLTCSHCAGFAENVFPMLQSKYIDTGKVRFVSREFPLEGKAAAAAMLARCVAAGDVAKYFEAVLMLFKRQDALIEHTTDTLKDVGNHFGMETDAVENCVKDQGGLDRLAADQKFAYEKLKVDATPTFFINGQRVRGSMSFEELDARLVKLMKH